jgi:hypothetical protein
MLYALRIDVLINPVTREFVEIDQNESREIESSIAV